MTEKPEPCPFCGSIPTVEPWHGGGSRKTMVHCSDDWCEVAPSVTGTTRSRTIAAWNRRKP